MFQGSSHRKKSGGILGIVRLFISLIVFAILGVGLIQSYRSFSGVDPLKLDPKSIAKSIIASESMYQIVTSILSFTPGNSFGSLKYNLTNNIPSKSESSDATNSPFKFRFAVMADSHLDISNLNKALNIAKSQDVKFIVGMGDFSDVGTTEELINTKRSFDIVRIPYYLTPGDRDLWDSRNKKLDASLNFTKIFNNAYQSFSYDNVRIILVYNSDNYLGVDNLQLKWIDDELARVQEEATDTIFAFAPTPLYHPSSDHVMGKTEPKLKSQAQHLASIFKKYGVAEVFSADTHYFSRYNEPINNLKMTTVGAVTSQRNPQTPRFVLIDVMQDGSYNVREIEVK